MNNAYNVIVAIKNILQTNKDLLNDLDQKIGDGDHGTNILRGVQKISDDFQNYNHNSYQTIFKSCAMTIISQVGGSSGALLGTALLDMANVVEDNNTVENWYETINVGIKGIERRGHGQAGEKTMLDALYPVTTTMKENLTLSWPELLLLMSKAAKQGAQATKDLLATKGRASYLHERSIGHIDPGAYSISLIFQAINEVLSG